jgi:transcriptional regulator with XRE-family HTH domain
MLSDDEARELWVHIVRTAIAEAGLSQAAVAEQMGVTQQTVSKWASGEAIPRLPMLRRLIRLIGIGPLEMLAVLGYETPGLDGTVRPT